MGHYSWVSTKDYTSHSQRGIRTMLHPLLSRWFRMNDMNLSFPVFADMMFANTVSKRGNSCAPVYATDCRWTRAFQMTSRSETHETLLLLFAMDGVLPACVSNNANDIIQGKLYQKLKGAAWHLKQLEPFTLWSNAAKGEIKELKKRTSHKLLWSRAPKCLWDGG